MFPFDIEDEEVDIGISETEESIPVEYGIDFETGQLTGKKVYGLDAIKVWIWNALATSRYRYQHHSWEYGHELENLIGTTNDIDYISASARGMIEECLKVNHHIKGIDDFQCKNDGQDKITCSFRVITDLGDIEGEEINV